MPKGVEHTNHHYRMDLSGSPPRSSMPKGVEHQDAIVEIYEPVTAEIFDAERR